MATCKYCGKWSGLFENEHLDCAAAHEASVQGANDSVPEGQSDVQPRAVSARQSAMATVRYRDGYRIAGSIDGLGSVIKVVALLFGGLLALAGLAYFGESKEVSFVLVLMGILTGGIGYVLGILVQAAGQLMKALFDVAVSGSHFLTDDQRAKVMGLE